MLHRSRKALEPHSRLHAATIGMLLSKYILYHILYSLSF